MDISKAKKTISLKLGNFFSAAKAFITENVSDADPDEVSASRANTVFSIARAVLSVCVVYATKTVYDVILPAGSTATNSLIAVATGLALIYLFDGAFNYIGQRLNEIVAASAEKSLCSSLYSKLLRAPMAQQPSTRDAQATFGQIEQAKELRHGTFAALKTDFAIASALLLVMLVETHWLALVPVVIGVVLGVITKSLNGRLTAIQLEISKTGATKAQLLAQTTAKVATIKTLRAEALFERQMDEALEKAAEPSKAIQALSHTVMIASAAAGQIATSASVVIGAILVHQGVISTGAMVMSSYMTARTIAPLLALMSVSIKIARAKAAKAQLFKVEALEGEEQDTMIEIENVRGHIVFDNVTHFYASRQLPSLNGVSLEIPAGEIVVIKGRSGSAKSTLLALMNGLLDLHSDERSSGSIRLDGLDIAQIKRSSLRRHVMLDLQEPQLFDATIWENVRMGRPDATDAEVRQAVEIACCLDWVNEMPLGVATRLVDGEGLSGGQRYMLSLARSILADPTVLLLDEPVSHISEDRAVQVMANLRRWAKTTGKTVVIVSHQGLVDPYCDRAYFLDRGQVVGSMTAEQAKAQAEATKNQTTKNQNKAA